MSGMMLGGAPQMRLVAIAATSFANLPSVAAEGVIGVITTTPITRMYITDDRPAGRPAGEIRVVPAGHAINKARVCVNPLVEYYPMSVYQTNGTTWTLMEAYLRKNAAWVRIRTYFYQAGVLGLVTSLVGSNTGAASYAINADHCRVDLGTGGTTGFAKICPGQTIDITEVNTLKMRYTRVRSGAQGSHIARLVLATTQLTATGTGVTYVDVPASADGLVSIDTSALTGLVYWHIMISKTSYYESDYIRMTELWGE